MGPLEISFMSYVLLWLVGGFFSGPVAYYAVVWTENNSYHGWWNPCTRSRRDWLMSSVMGALFGGLTMFLAGLSIFIVVLWHVAKWIIGIPVCVVANLYAKSGRFKEYLDKPLCGDGS